MTSVRITTARAVVVVVVTAAAAGCDADRAATPRDVVPLAASAAHTAATRAAIADISARVLPGSQRLAASAELGDAIGAVNRAIERNDARALTAALDRADRAVSGAAQADAVDGAELDAIRLALESARRLVEPSPSP